MAQPVQIVQKFDTSHVSKLTDSNYEIWKLQVSLVLKAAKLWPYVCGDTVKPEGAAAAAWSEKDVQAQAIMVPTLNAMYFMAAVPPEPKPWNLS